MVERVGEMGGWGDGEKLKNIYSTFEVHSEAGKMPALQYFHHSPCTSFARNLLYLHHYHAGLPNK
ncbi:MAG: hypothetical protein F6K24_35400 [Okeania sp. SIO2D1]|nr:hypothetical protein [Okeania sp. SIO2D1]